MKSIPAIDSQTQEPLAVFTAKTPFTSRRSQTETLRFIPADLLPTIISVL